MAASLYSIFQIDFKKYGTKWSYCSCRTLSDTVPSLWRRLRNRHNFCLYFLKSRNGNYITFNVISSEQDASSMPDGSHLIALTSFWNKKWFYEVNIPITCIVPGPQERALGVYTCNKFNHILQPWLLYGGTKAVLLPKHVIWVCFRNDNHFVFVNNTHNQSSDMCSGAKSLRPLLHRLGFK